MTLFPAGDLSGQFMLDHQTIFLIACVVRLHLRCNVVQSKFYGRQKLFMRVCCFCVYAAPCCEALSSLFVQAGTQKSVLPPAAPYISPAA